MTQPQSEESSEQSSSSPPLDTALKRRRTALDERCWIRCRQTNRGRYEQIKPQCTCLCYLNLRNTPRRDQSDAIKEPEDLRYRPKFLRDRYIYFARGQPALVSHLESMISMSVLELREKQAHLEQVRREQDPPSPHEIIEQRQQARSRAAMGIQPESEKLISLSDTVQESCLAVHNHFVRTLRPFANTLMRIPKVYEDGTHIQLANNFWTRIRDGEPLILGKRAFTSSLEMLNRIAIRRGWKDDSGDNSAGP